MLPDDLISAGLALDVRTAQPDRDAIDGVVPRLVLEPHTPEAGAAALGWASEHRLSLVIEGAGTKRRWGRPPDRLDAILSTRRLNRVLAHRHGDLTATVEAGVSLSDLNRVLAAHRQWLPLDPPAADRATIGGLLATNDSGPLRHRFGTPRDLVIGVRLATSDGRLASAGGQVVKNVAGYDLSKLVAGSFGSLAVIVSATFKLLPLPAEWRTLILDLERPELSAGIADAIAASQVEPFAFELRARRPAGGAVTAACHLRFASIPEALDAQIQQVRRLVSGRGVEVREAAADEESRLWRESPADNCRDQDALVRVSWLPADLGRVLDVIAALDPAVELDLAGRIEVGAGLMRLTGSVDRLAAVIEQLRASAVVGNVVVSSAAPALKAAVDVWGPHPALEVLQAVKRAVDPGSTLGAGRGVI